MRIPWKPVLFVLANAVFVAILAWLVFGLLNSYGDDSELGWAIFAIIPACVFFVGIGIFLFVFGEWYSILLLNKLLPFLAVLAFLLPAVFAGGVRTKTVPAISIALAVLMMLAICTTVAVLIRNRGGEGDL